ncbi:MAG: hypothetical protein WCO23_02010 [bacterium]
MSKKIAIGVGAVIGSYIGSYIASLLGAGIFSPWNIVVGAIGAILGILLAYKIFVD